MNKKTLINWYVTKSCHGFVTWFGCVKFQKPKTVWAILKAIEADVNKDPAHAKEPQMYAKKLEYFLGDKTRVHTYWPPAEGIALESSESVIPTQYDMKAMMIIPYTIKRGPPDWMPVINEAEIPNQEFVKPKPIPNTDQTENVLLSSPLCWLELSEEAHFSWSLLNTERETSFFFSSESLIVMRRVSKDGSLPETMYYLVKVGTVKKRKSEKYRIFHVSYPFWGKRSHLFMQVCRCVHD